MTGNRHVRFCSRAEVAMLRLRQHVDKLTACLAELGWEPIWQHAYGLEKAATHALLLCRLRGDK